MKKLILAMLLSMSTVSSYGGTILQFTQSNLSDKVTATDSGGVTTLSTTGNMDGGGLSIPVIITGGINAYETFIDVHSTAPALLINNAILQSYMGTIAITSGINDTGTNYLTASFTNIGLAGNLGGPNNGTGAALANSSPPDILVITSDIMTIVNPTSMAIGFTNVSPSLSINSDGSIASFTAQNTGTFAGTAIPEPSSILLWGIGILIITLKKVA